MLPSRYIFSIGTIALLLNVSAVCAQQQGQAAPSQAPSQSRPSGSQQQGQDGGVQPVPAYRSPLASAAGNDSLQEGSANDDQLVPDTRLPAGAQNLALGSPKTGHGYWDPYLDISSAAYSNYGGAPGSASWSTFGSVSGGINLREISGQSDLTLTYLGGASFAGDGSGTQDVQELGIVERFSYRRTSFALMDQLGYLPAASFGYNGLGTGAQNPTGNLGLQSSFAPAQTILASTGKYLSNSSIVEIDRYLTRRSSITLAGDYNIVRYFDNSDLFDSNEAVFQVGYNHQLSRKGTISVFYRFDGYRYSNGTQSINNQSVQLSYARRLVGKLALQLSAGPDYASSRLPLSTTSPVAPTGTSIAVTTGTATQLSWGATANLMYQTRRSSLDLTYSHGVTGGSGILAGSNSDNIYGDATQQFTRKSNVTLSAGYSRSTGLPFLDLTTGLKTSNVTYNSTFAGVTLNRSWGSAMRLYVGYEVQYQTSGGQSCVATLCNFTNHEVYLGLGWHPQHSFRGR